MGSSIEFNTSSRTTEYIANEMKTSLDGGERGMDALRLQHILHKPKPCFPHNDAPYKIT